MADIAPSGAVKSAMRTLDVLELVVGQARPMPASEIAVALAIPVSSLSYLLSTLVERGYLERAGRLYAAGRALAQLHPRAGGPSLAERTAPLVRILRRELNETASFFVRRDDEIEAIATEVGNHALRYTVSVGQRAPLHSFAAGKALLAEMPPADFDDYLATVQRQRFTAATLVEGAALRDEIETVRRDGIAHTREEHTAGIVGIGRAARIDGAVIGAFSVAIPVARFSPEVEKRTADMLIEVIGRLERSARQPVLPT